MLLSTQRNQARTDGQDRNTLSVGIEADMFRFLAVALTGLVLLTALASAQGSEDDEFADQVQVVLEPQFPDQNDSLDAAWEHYCTEHGKSYIAEEKAFRRANWEESRKKIEQHNREANEGKHTYWLKVNQFSDLNDQDFKWLKTGFRFDPTRAHDDNETFSETFPNETLPIHVDWRKKGYVTPVEDQGFCGSSWAFSATGALEGLHFKKTHRLVSLSEQNLVDCSEEQGNEGCYGGEVKLAFKYVAENGIESEQSYHYKGQDESCQFHPHFKAATCARYISIPSGREDLLEKAVAFHGPVSVAIDSSLLKHYHHGILSNSDCGKNIDHAVLVVGYGWEVQEDHKVIDYWIIKNSWGTSWGEDGYLRLEKGVNRCGVALDASYPV